jgi:hypothetical protein
MAKAGEVETMLAAGVNPTHAAQAGHRPQQRLPSHERAEDQARGECVSCLVTTADSRVRISSPVLLGQMEKRTAAVWPRS